MNAWIIFAIIVALVLAGIFFGELVYRMCCRNQGYHPIGGREFPPFFSRSPVFFRGGNNPTCWVEMGEMAGEMDGLIENESDEEMEFMAPWDVEAQVHNQGEQPQPEIYPDQVEQQGHPQPEIFPEQAEEPLFAMELLDLNW